MISPSSIRDITQSGDTVIAAADRGHFRFAAFADNIIHVAYYPTDKAQPLPMWGIEPRPDNAPGIVWEDTSKGWELTLAGISVQVNREDSSCMFNNDRGQPLTHLQMVGLTPIRLSGDQTFHEIGRAHV